MRLRSHFQAVFFGGMCIALFAGCSSDDDSNPMTTSTPGSPVITSVSWAPSGICNPGSSADMDIVVTATDDKDAASAMTYTSGNITSCTGTIDGITSTVNCPQTGTYSGTATVTDTDGNSTSRSFSFGPCDTGSTP